MPVVRPAPSIRSLSVRLAQSACFDSHWESNLQHTLSLIEASAQRTDLVVLPEGAVTGRFPAEVAHEAAAWSGTALDAIAVAAQWAAVCVVINLPEWDAGRLYSTLFLVDERGSVVARHRKTLLAQFETAIFSTGDRYALHEWHGLKLGLLFGVEVEHRDAVEALVSQGIELLVVSSAFSWSGQTTRRQLVESVASCHGVPIALVNRSGQGDHEAYSGSSGAFDARGCLLVQAGPQECITDAELTCPVFSSHSFL